RTLPEIYKHLLQAIASHEIGDRPGREEPRCVKRRPKPYPRLTQPRNEVRTACREKG
ncbi:MAG TPA: IS4 family transposase, partial [Thermoguttaceae bacterium]|nr:IS4 family transposase [Thermoguttaceae bacterium]